MAPDGRDTRTRILDAAERLVLTSGFSSTSVDQIQTAAGISRGTFFYHFPSKDDLARELLVRYARRDRELAEEFMERAERLARDPLEQVRVFLGLYEELLEEMATGETGCLFASYSYEAGLFDDETHRIIAESVEHWTGIFARKLEEAFAEHPPRVDVDAATLAETAYCLFEGGLVLSRIRSDVEPLTEQLRFFRTWIELLCGAVGVEEAAVP